MRTRRSMGTWGRICGLALVLMAVTRRKWSCCECNEWRWRAYRFGANVPCMSALTHSAAPPRDGAHDFDFVHGRWRVHNRRLRRPLSASHDWYEVEGRTRERPLWDGQGNIEEYDAEPPGGRLRVLALRLYSPTARQWSIFWSNSATGTLDK